MKHTFCRPQTGRAKATPSLSLRPAFDARNFPSWGLLREAECCVAPRPYRNRLEASSAITGKGYGKGERSPGIHRPNNPHAVRPHLTGQLGDHHGRCLARQRRRDRMRRLLAVSPPAIRDSRSGGKYLPSRSLSSATIPVRACLQALLVLDGRSGRLADAENHHCNHAHRRNHSPHGNPHLLAGRQHLTLSSHRRRAGSPIQSRNCAVQHIAPQVTFVSPAVCDQRRSRKQEKPSCSDPASRRPLVQTRAAGEAVIHSRIFAHPSFESDRPCRLRTLLWLKIPSPVIRNPTAAALWYHFTTIAFRNQCPAAGSCSTH